MNKKQSCSRRAAITKKLALVIFVTSIYAPLLFFSTSKNAENKCLICAKHDLRGNRSYSQMYCPLLPIPKKELGGLNKEVLDILLFRHSLVAVGWRAYTTPCRCHPTPQAEGVYGIGSVPTAQMDFFKCFISTFFFFYFITKVTLLCSSPKDWRQGK